MAVDCGCALRTGFRGGDAVYLGLRKDGTWDAGSDGSAAKAGGDRAVPVCAESDVSGFFAGWAGLWAIFRRASVEAIAWASAVPAAVALFVVLYEQPTLRRKFGEDYEEYCRNVRAWIPRMRPWVK
jgi:hypothetical protein